MNEVRAVFAQPSRDLERLVEVEPVRVAVIHRREADADEESRRYRSAHRAYGLADEPCPPLRGAAPTPGDAAARGRLAELADDAHEVLFVRGPRALHPWRLVGRRAPGSRARQ